MADKFTSLEVYLDPCIFFDHQLEFGVFKIRDHFVYPTDPHKWTMH